MLESTVIQGVGDELVDAFCRECDNSLIYSSSHYIRLVSDETASTPYWVLVKENGCLVAALPLLVREGALGAVVNSLAYYGSNGGVITRDGNHALMMAALKEYTLFCDSINAVSSTLITNPLLGDQDFYETHLAHDFRDERIGQFTFFPESAQPEELMQMFEDPRPRNIRKAQREQITVQALQSDEALDFLYSTHFENITSINGLPKRARFFKAIPDCLPGDAWKVFVASKDGEWIAALLLLYFNGTVEYFTPSVVEQHRSSQALSLVIYEAMLEAMKRGFTKWNWGGTWLSQDGVYGFKKKWGTRDLRYYYYTRLRDPKLLQATREQLLSEYPGFFVLPFSALTASQANQEAI